MIILLNFVISYIQLGKEIEKDFAQDSKKTLLFNESIIKNRISHYQREIETLAESPFIATFASRYRSGDKQLIQTNNEYLIDLAKAHDDMMQIRYICNSGNEIVRVDRQGFGDELKLIPADELQNKKHRYYFKELSKMPQGSVWYSDIDLNIEHGKIQVPYQPTLRIGVPVFVKGERRGMIIVNIFMKILLEKLQTSQNYQLYLTDTQGNFLLHTNPKYNWSLYLGKEHTFFDEFPNIAPQVIGRTSFANKYIFSKELSFKNSSKYYMIAKLNAGMIKQVKNNLIKQFVLIGFVVMFIGFPFGVLIAHQFEHLSSRLYAIIDSLGDGIFILNKEKNTTYINNKALEILEYSAHEIIGHKSHKRLQHSDSDGKYIEEEHCPINNINITKQQVHSEDNIFVSKSGRRINVEFTATPFFVNNKFEGSITIFRDITQKKLLEVEIKKLSKAIEQIDDLVVITDRNGVITYVNRAFCNFTGYSREEAIGETPSLYKSSKHTASEIKELWDTILDSKVYRAVIINKKKNGELYYEEKTITPLSDDKGNITSFVSTAKDITERVEMEVKLEKLASTDYLTGLYNRRKFEEIFTTEISRCRRYNEPLSLIMFDIDHFKNINDTFGHDVGDVVLKELSKLIKSHIRQSDALARWGGEEFMLLTPEIDKEAAYLLAEKLRQSVNSFVFAQVGQVSCSLGVVQLLENEDFNSCSLRADKAMYKAKKGGRNRTVKA